jgi:hypothetical protein
MTIYSVSIDTNQIELDTYRGDFEAIYARHLANLLPRPQQYVGPLRVRAAFDLGEYCFYPAGEYFDIDSTGITEVPAVTHEAFYEYVSEIVRSEHAFPFSISRAMVLNDPVAGYGVHLIPDKSAAAALTRLHNRLIDGRLGEEMYYERGDFVANAQVLWARVPREVLESVVKAINDLPIDFNGYVNTIEISYWNAEKRERELKKTFKLAS